MSPKPAIAPPPVVPAPCPADKPKLSFRRGKRSPRAIAWLGARSFWGHLWHLAASAIATEDIDSRDWMVADEPEELTRRVARELGHGDSPGLAGEAPSLTEAAGRDLWLDFIADTGDCSSVSYAVARLLFATYDVPDPEGPEGARLHLPRGELLVFGGDTAYPVATEREIHNRVIVPWNQILKTMDDGAKRVLIGIPGNHDWYDGLDGFGRMFRRRRGRLDRAAQNASDVPDPDGQIKHLIRWVEAFSVGRFVGKRSALPLQGYVPVQSASYWALHLAPGLDLWGPDRQLRAVDFRQRTYFATAGGEKRPGIVMVMADPVLAFLEPSRSGQEILRSLDLDLEGDGLLVLTGDTHHYCREHMGRGVHVTAGGGGAFLHPARIARAGKRAPEAEFPGPAASLSLAVQIPLQIAHGRSGFLVHAGVALLYLPAFGLEAARGASSPFTAAVTAIIAGLVCFFIGGFRSPRAASIGALALATGALVGFLPFALQELAIRALPRIEALVHLSALQDEAMIVALIALTFASSVYAGTVAFGSFLTALTVLGLEHHQAFSALAHPGYKHIVRLRVHRDGSRVDGFVLGRVDPLGPKDKVVLVDRFTWQNPAAVAPEEARREGTMGG